MNYKLTLDVNLMNSDQEVPGMATLKRWQAEEKLTLTEADRPLPSKEPAAYGWPGAAPKPAEPGQRGRRRSGKMNESGNANFKSVASVLFPSKDPLRLAMGEINTVAHLIRHHSVKNDIFVTANTKVLIDEGRRERLRKLFGIEVLTPVEVVQKLGEAEGWEIEPAKSAKSAVKSKAGKKA